MPFSVLTVYSERTWKEEKALSGLRCLSVVCLQEMQPEKTASYYPTLRLSLCCTFMSPDSVAESVERRPPSFGGRSGIQNPAESNKRLTKSILVLT